MRTKYQTPTTPKTAVDTIVAAVEFLRIEWRDGLRGRQIGRVLSLIRESQNLAHDNELSLRLARIDARLGTYQYLSDNERRAELTSLAGELKRLEESAARRLPVAPKSALSKPNSPPHTQTQLQLTASVTALPRVGEQVARKLAKLGLVTVADVLAFLPRRHVDYSKTTTIRDAVGFGMKREVTVRGAVLETTEFDGPPARFTIKLGDNTGFMRVTWFNRFLSRQIRVGDEIAISGSLDHGYGTPSATNPEWEPVGGPGLSTGRLTPVYNLTQGVSQKQVRSLTRAALDGTTESLQEFLPEEIRRRHDLAPLCTAVHQAHFPSDLISLKRAHQRISFDELFLLELGLVKLKQKRAAGTSPAFDREVANVDRFLAGLPFQLTTAQHGALAEVLIDLQRPTPMSRLLQGDVGSGKTVIAVTAALVATANDYQTAVMAPTEILAEQHFQSFSHLTDHLSANDRPRISVLTGSTQKRARKSLLRQLESREIDILIGTHALIQDAVQFASVGLVVIDEQHRFGVKQRGHLSERASEHQPHVLSMTATPIPRTLNLVLNGDLDVSVIDQLPPGRIPIVTRRYSAVDRGHAWELARAELATGRQVFVICPLIEESESLDAKAVVTEAGHLQNIVFPEYRVQVLHGRLSGKEKDRIMEAFRNRESDILVTTSVIEVGIDIPNASMMVIEGAERFGLAQLHQLRGRVGRGANQSYCLLLADEGTADAELRLEMMVESNDGFALAERDLEIRGPGDFIGTRQSGLPEMSSTIRFFDTRILDAARKEAESVLGHDPGLTRPEHARLRDRAMQFWKNAAPDLSLA